MPYDKNLDKQLWSESTEFEMTRITVGIYSYNDGEKKLQISRENRTQDNEWRWGKLGRMTKEEAEKVLPLIEQAIKAME